MIVLLLFLVACFLAFSNGANDNFKGVATLFGSGTTDHRKAFWWGTIATAMAIGGIVSARGVGDTMSRKSTPINDGQGFTANPVTGILVTTASLHGLPASTTYVSVGSLFGIGAATGQGSRKVAKEILLSWVLTLPLAALLGAACYTVLV